MKNNILSVLVGICLCMVVITTFLNYLKINEIGRLQVQRTLTGDSILQNTQQILIELKK